MKFRKPEQRKQGLKILGYGENGAGKSLFGLSFPKIAYIDSESKVGVYESDERFKDNLVGIADTASYYDVIDLMNNVVKDSKSFNTLVIDSITAINDSMQVSAMEQEESRARQKGGNVDDSTVSMRGWGKIKLNTIRVNQLIAQASANGITTISIAHKEDVNQEVGGKQIKIGERPSLRKNAEHTYDVVLRFYKEKDIVSGQYKFMAEVEKDTTNTYKIGTKLENLTYENFSGYIERTENAKTIETNYDKTIEGDIDSMKKEQEDHDTIVNEFKELYKPLSADAEKKAQVAKLLKQHGIEKYNDPASTQKLKVVIEEMKKM